MAVLVIPALAGKPILADFLFRAPLSAAIQSVVQQDVQMAMGIAIRKVTQLKQVLGIQLRLLVHLLHLQRHGARGAAGAAIPDAEGSLEWK
eukprot:CAMPEP_0181487556 /NCGR_PEP_ID=MMETSP1110-20121109/47879_1 /TAXON_ID=174948 /ORGANISM="Symbiodinium sp., Strain CCMP421" /LENGTH=90 /DNA_ID=CAMNT_0023614065 /DNA_START=783 /DNA_END=1055 /DNA_ORIENTATION=+